MNTQGQGQSGEAGYHTLYVQEFVYHFIIVGIPWISGSSHLLDSHA